MTPMVSWIIVPLSYGGSRGLRVKIGMFGCPVSRSALTPFEKVHLILNATMFGGIPFAVMAFVYCRIAIISWLQSNRDGPGRNHYIKAGKATRKKKKEKKWIRTLVFKKKSCTTFSYENEFDLQDNHERASKTHFHTKVDAPGLIKNKGNSLGSGPLKEKYLEDFDCFPSKL
ncbi:hypothetical protein ACROYT_G013027 [Oculina patagonica]